MEHHWLKRAELKTFGKEFLLPEEHLSHIIDQTVLKSTEVKIRDWSTSKFWLGQHLNVDIILNLEQNFIVLYLCNTTIFKLMCVV